MLVGYYTGYARVRHREVLALGTVFTRERAREAAVRETAIRLSRLLKNADNKAAGSAATEAYPCGTSQGDGRLRTQ